MAMMMKNAAAVAVAIGIAATVSNGPSSAQVVGQPLEVEVNVVGTCVLSLSGDGGWLMDFGVIEVAPFVEYFADFTFEVRCPSGSAYRVYFDVGENFLLSPPSGQDGRRMRRLGSASADDRLRYGLYPNSSYQDPFRPWHFLSGTSDGTSVSHTVYGKIYGTQWHLNHLPGTYEDTVELSLVLD